MAEKNIGKITQIISAVIDIKFAEGNLPEINSAINIKTKDGGKLVVEVAQHLGDDTVRCIALGPLMVLLEVWKQKPQEHLFQYLLVSRHLVESLMY